MECLDVLKEFAGSRWEGGVIYKMTKSKIKFLGFEKIRIFKILDFFTKNINFLDRIRSRISTLQRPPMRTETPRKRLAHCPIAIISL